MTAANPVRIEICAVKRENLACFQRFGRHYERGVGEIHRTVRVLFHVFEGARDCRTIKKPDGQATLQRERAQAIGTDTLRLEHMEKPPSVPPLCSRAARADS